MSRGSVLRVSMDSETVRGLIESGTATRTAVRVPITPILGVPIAQVDETTTIAELTRLAVEEAPVHVVYVNAHTLDLAHQSPG